MAMIEKKCYFIEGYEFIKLAKSLFTDVEDFDVEIDSVCGIYFDGVTNKEVYSRIGDYIGCNVSSIHTDHHDSVGVWIVCGLV